MADQQRSATAGDMIRSILVVLVPVLLLMALLTQTPDEPEVPTVPWQPVLAKARSEAPWPVVAPAGLPEGKRQWRPTRAHWSKAGQPGPLGGAPSPRNQWLLGMIGPDGIHYAVNQADGDVPSFVAETTRAAMPAGDETIAGQKWERFETGDGRTRALVRRGGKDVVTVVADTDFGHLNQFARTLSQG
ncbi:DUF4245 domain-containing protein [Mariniluteicoccus flavus]